MQMSVRYADTSDASRAESQAFPFTESFESLVTMPNEVKIRSVSCVRYVVTCFLFQFVGVYVASTVSDNAVIVSMEQYQDGMAPVLLVNHTDDLEVYYRQK